MSCKIFRINIIKNTYPLKLITLPCILLLGLLSFSSLSLAVTSHPTWLSEALAKAEQLNTNNPVLALDFTLALLKKHNDQLSLSGKAAIFSRLAEYHSYLGNNKGSLKYINKYYALISDLATSDGISLLITHGSVLDSLGKTKQAMDLYILAEKHAKAIENKQLLGESYAAMGSSYSASLNDSEALKYFHKAYLLFKESGNELELAYLKVQMSHSYSYIYDDEKAVSLAIEAIEYFQQHEYYFDELFAQNALAKINMGMKEYDQAITMYLRVMELSKLIEKDSFIEFAYLGLAKAYYNKKQYDRARHYYTLYQEIHADSDSPFSKIDDYFFAASLALIDKNIPLVEKRINQVETILSTLDKSTVLYWHVRLLDLKADIAVLSNEFKSAYELQKEARKLLYSYQNSEREHMRSKYKVMFDIDQALLKNQLLERDKQLDKIALDSSEKQHNLQTLLTFAVSLIALILILFIYRQRKNSEILHKLANTDMLTELANRRYSFRYAEKMLLQAKKNKQNFSLIIFDIDYFKKINDTYGHSGGDIALKDIALVASEYVRSNDILGRIGGEEFLVILPKTSSKQAYEVAERIRHGIEKRDILLGNTIVNISASFGISQLAQNQPTFNQIFHEADLALYQAKNNGRNCISLAN